jgi:hypothetical protein
MYITGNDNQITIGSGRFGRPALKKEAVTTKRLRKIRADKSTSDGAIWQVRIEVADAIKADQS